MNVSVKADEAYVTAVWRREVAVQTDGPDTSITITGDSVDVDEQVNDWVTSVDVDVTPTMVRLGVGMFADVGGFTVTFEKGPDGNVYLHVPYDYMPEPHCGYVAHHLHSGTYIIQERKVP